MDILRRASFRTMPWKNGGGETTEIVVSPASASMDDFDWRVSMARVATDGPFSIFAGIDRSLTLLEGEGIILSIAGQGDVHLTRQSPPLAFPGDAATDSRLVGGAILDLNVMTRRGVYAAKVERVAGGAVLPLDPAKATLLFLSRYGGAEGPDFALGDGDALVLPQGDTALSLRLDSATEGFLIHIMDIR